MSARLLAISLALATAHLPQERDFSLMVDAGKEECFFEEVPKGNTLTVEYQVTQELQQFVLTANDQVIDGGDGQMSELDINFKMLSPRGHPLVAEFKKSEGTHSQLIEVCSYILICF